MNNDISTEDAFNLAAQEINVMVPDRKNARAFVENFAAGLPEIGITDVTIFTTVRHEYETLTADRAFIHLPGTMFFSLYVAPERRDAITRFLTSKGYTAATSGAVKRYKDSNPAETNTFTPS
jgi:hypothetical protein